MARAMTSLPEPVSPSNKTGTSDGATCSTRSITGPKPVSAPTIDSVMSWRSSRDRSACLSASSASRSDCISRSRESFSKAAANGSSSSCTSSRCVCENDPPVAPTIRIRPSGVPSSVASGPMTISASRVRDATKLAGSSPNQRGLGEDPTAPPACQLVTLPSANHERSSPSSV